MILMLVFFAKLKHVRISRAMNSTRLGVYAVFYDIRQAFDADLYIFSYNIKVSSYEYFTIFGL